MTRNVAFEGVYAVPSGRPRRWHLVADRAVVVEVGRVGRRSRYHRGSRQGGTGALLTNEQCQIDQAGAGVRVLEALPAMLRPWSQLCRRCWAGTDELLAAALQYAEWRERKSA